MQVWSLLRPLCWLWLLSVLVLEWTSADDATFCQRPVNMELCWWNRNNLNKRPIRSQPLARPTYSYIARASPMTGLYSADDPPPRVRRQDPYLRIGRQDPYLRIGRQDPYLRIGRSDPYLRIGRSDPYLRIGRSDPYLRIGRSDPYLRIGRGEGYLRFGRDAQTRDEGTGGYLRFGRATSIQAPGAAHKLQKRDVSKSLTQQVDDVDKMRFSRSSGPDSSQSASLTEAAHQRKKRDVSEPEADMTRERKESYLRFGRDPPVDPRDSLQEPPADTDYLPFAQDPKSPDSKRENYLRFGKRENYLRFGKRENGKRETYLRFGKSDNEKRENYLRFGKRENYLRFGKREGYLRFGKRSSES